MINRAEKMMIALPFHRNTMHESSYDVEYHNLFLSRHRVIVELHESETNRVADETIEAYYITIEHMTVCMRALYQNMVRRGLRMPQWEYDEAIFYEFLAHNVIS